ncbi:MAG: ABC transporter permease [Bacteroidales bacterium]|nr:ABC transporter permease [Bacteroidales bacterium]
MITLFSRNRRASIASGVVLLILWELVARMMGSAQILPGPVSTFRSLVEIIGQDGFLQSIGLTLLRGLTGFIAAFISGLLIGILSGYSATFEAVFRPVLVTLRSTPVVAIILLALIWFRVDQVPVFIAFLTMFPVLTQNITEGIRQTDPDLLEMARLYRINPVRVFTGIHLPALTPYLFSGISTAVGFGWRAVIIGEVLSQPRYGIGSMMQGAQSYLLVSELIAWTFIAVSFSYLFELLLIQFRKRMIRWKP